MKNLTYRVLASLLLFVMVGAAAFAQITPSQDSYTNTSASSTNYGSATTLGVASSGTSVQTAYIQFDLSSVPAGYNSNNIAKATLKLYVDSVTTAGSFNVDYVNGSWSEKTITAGLSPVLGSTIVSGVSITGANANNYLQIDLTSAVGGWLNGAQVNDGIALVANGGLAAAFESKENTNQSHPAELDIVYTTGGTITGVTTVNGSGLTGGGTSGTLKIGLQKTCATNQILQWNGSSWVCSSTGTGSVSSVGLSAPASDFTVNGSPVTGTGTLNFAWNLSPTNTNTPNAIVKRDASGDFDANIISTGELVTQSVVASSAVISTSANTDTVLMEGFNSATSGSQSWGIFGGTDSATTGATAIVGHAFATSGGVVGVSGITDSTTGSASGVVGIATPTSGGYGVGVRGIANGSSGYGVYGFTSTASVLGNSGLPAGVWGDSGAAGSLGVLGTVDDGLAGLFSNNSTSGYPTLAAFNENGAAYPFLAYNNVTSSSCNIDASANLNCTGAKHAIVPIDGGQRTVALSAIESPKNWFEDFGSAQLSAGAVVVALEPDFAQTVNTGMEYHIFLTPNGDCKGLYVSRKTASSFEVRELGGGTSSVSFDYRIVALRKNFENIRLEDHSKDLDIVKRVQARKNASQPRLDVKGFVAAQRQTPTTRPFTPKAVK